MRAQAQNRQMELEVGLICSRFSLRTLPWLVAATVLATGVFWRDSVLIACSALFALHAFELDMDAGAPWQAWRAALRCGVMGAASLLCGLILWVIVGAVRLDWWTPANDRPDDVLLTLAIAAAICLLVRSQTHRLDFRLFADLVVPTAVVLTLATSTSGWEEAPFLFAVLVALAVTHVGWRRLQGAGAIWRFGDGR